VGQGLLLSGAGTPNYNYRTGKTDASLCTVCAGAEADLTVEMWWKDSDQKRPGYRRGRNRICIKLTCLSRISSFLVRSLFIRNFLIYLNGVVDSVQVVPEIIYEDNHVLVAFKPPGLLTQGDISGAPCLLEVIKDHIKQRDNKPGNVYLGMVQRLDRPVSGVIIFAKTSKAAGRLSSQIRNRQVGKLYVALTSQGNMAGSIPTQWCEVSNHLLRVRDKTTVIQSSSRHSQHGVLRMKTLWVNERSCFHLIELVTGRKHQIRSQLAHLGMPISGDQKYGSRRSYHLQGGIGLHALCCLFEHPVKREKMLISAAVPDGFSIDFSSAEMEMIKSALVSEIDCFGEGCSGQGSLVI
jgi:23S rRNA pseudouridine1911/1915/1917 synthase